MNKGSQMAVSGRIQTGSYEAKDGTKRYVTEVVANEVEFLGKGMIQLRKITLGNCWIFG